jgi:lipid A 3-O-deacylase
MISWPRKKPGAMMAMWGKAAVSGIALVLAAALAGPVLAQDLYSTEPASSWTDVLSEVRLGLNAHNATSGFLPIIQARQFDLGEFDDLSFDVLFKSPDIDAFRWLLSPRPNVGATINLQGKESTFHAGLTWQAHIFSSPIYVEGTFGAAANTGYLNDAPVGYRNLGCRVQFYETFGVGADLGSNWDATLSYEHTSNADLCSANQGLSNLGVRIGYKF